MEIYFGPHFLFELTPLAERWEELPEAEVHGGENTGQTQFFERIFIF